MSDQRPNEAYEILSNLHLEKLRYQVNCYVAAGYVPVGGVCVHNSGSKVIEYHQAVFKAPVTV